MNSAKEFLEYLLNAIKIWIIVQPWERGLRVRAGNKVKKLTPGIYFRIPYIDSVYIQSVRLRVVSLPVQTLTTREGKTVTLNSAIGYNIVDIDKFYSKLYHPETTLQNMAASEIAEFIYNNTVAGIDPSRIEASVITRLKAEDYGIHVEYFRLTNFAIVRTYRLIQDHSWVSEGVNMDAKK